MSFKLTTATPTQLVFESPPSPSKRGAWLLVGGLLITAVIINRLFPGFEYPGLVILQALLVLIGWFFLMILVYSPGGTHLAEPARITLNRTRGVMEIEPQPGEREQPVTLPFSEVAKADLDVQTSTNDNNNTETTYHLYIELITGSRWYLCYTQNYDEAVKQLETVIDRSVSSASAMKVTLPQRWALQSSPDHLLVTWTNPLGNRPWRLLRQIIVFAAHLGGIIYAIASRRPAGELAIVLAICSPIIILVGWFGFRLLRRLVRDGVTQFAVRLSKDGLDYYEFAKAGGKMRNHVHVNLAAIDTFRHTHAPALVLPHDIEVVRKDDNEPLILFCNLPPIDRQRAVDWLRQQVTLLRTS